MIHKQWGVVKVKVENIQAGQRALSVNGEELNVVRAIRHISKEIQVTELVTDSGARMIFTASHAVMTPYGPKQAGTLLEGQDVNVGMASSIQHHGKGLSGDHHGNGLSVDHHEIVSSQPLTEVNTFPLEVDVYELVFDPDLPVKSFFEPPTILSKGADKHESSRKGKSYHQRQRINNFKGKVQVCTPEGSEGDREA